MVFFTSIVIVFILYYLQTDGLIYVVIIALVAELINILMTQTLTKSVEKKTALKFGKLMVKYKTRIAVHKKTIKELENIQEESIKKLYMANLKIKEYAEKIQMEDKDKSQPDNTLTRKIKLPEMIETPEEERQEEFIDLPSGSNRKKLPI